MLRTLIVVLALLVGGSWVRGEELPTPAAKTEIKMMTLDAITRNEVLNELARKVESDYALPDVSKQLAQMVKAKRSANAYRHITSALEFARAITDDLYALAHDKHLHVDFIPVSATPAPGGQHDNSFLELVRQTNGMVPKVEILDGNIGYMRVNGVPPLPLARDSVAAAFAYLHRTDALILDLRWNGGGDPNTVALYMSYLSEGPSYLVNTFHWRADNRVEEFRTTELKDLSYGAHKPVYVLTSPMTFSGGEELAYDIQAFKRGTLVGEVTGGGANPGGPEPLGHQFVVFMPSGYAVNAITGTNWEGKGVKPDVAIAASGALSKAQVMSIETLLAAANDPSRPFVEAAKLELASKTDTEVLPSERITGTYFLQSRGGAVVTIQERQSHLIQRIAGFPESTLVRMAGNRYEPEGHPDGFATSFITKGDRIYLLLEQPFGPATVGEKGPGAGGTQ